MAQIHNIHDAKTHFSELLRQAHQGEEIIIAKAGVPYARLVPLREEGRRLAGDFRNRISGDIVGPLASSEARPWG